MLFTEPLFFCFFLVVFGAYWALRSHRARKVWLLIASYVFYAAWDWRFLGLIFTSTVIDYVAGLGMKRAATPRARRAWLLLSLVGNLSLLGFFKYFNFFVTSVNPLLEWLGAGGVRTLQIVLPIGISFYTFQTLSYSIDVYRRKMRPTRDFLDFALFVGFFPQLVMGPILRAVGFLPQLDVAKRFASVRVKPMLALFLAGFIKKACISDNIAPFVDAVYADPAAYTPESIWIAVLFFAVQLYCDFSGYADMAIALAGLLGFQVPQNFNFPFFASDIQDFWRRWHISFSTWLRDYVYFPMGGSRGNRLQTDRNLFLTMLISGLWHGAGFNFVLWGGLNGVGLVLHRHYQSWRAVPDVLRTAFAWAGVPLVFLWFSFTCIFFRAGSMEKVGQILRPFLGFQSAGSESLDPILFLWLMPMALVHWLAMTQRAPERLERIPAPVFSLALGAATALALFFVRMEYRPFIYFQF